MAGSIKGKGIWKHLHRNLSKIGSFHSCRRLYNLNSMINRADILCVDSALRGVSLRGLLILIRL